jgi:PTH1 family peptidyl-tRNA hydrolase
MKVIVGLGNPGEKYKNTRHNAGFIFLDKLICHPFLSPVGSCLEFHKEGKFEALIAETNHKGEKIILVKPQTFMNLSGKAVARILNYYKAEKEDLIVVSDDIDLPIGTARIRQEGSSGGQKGLQNIIDSIGSDQFLRIRLGVKSIGGDADVTANPSNGFDATDFVLSVFPKRELVVLNQLVDRTIDYVTPFIGKDLEIPAHTLDVKIDSL